MKRLTFVILSLLAGLTSATAQADSTALTPAPTRFSPYNYGLWNLHEGMNVSVDLSAFASFGKHSSGGGFGQRLSATYIKTLDERLWMAIGGYVANTMYKGDSYRSGGIYATVGYRFDEHWEAMIYAQKSLVGNTPAFRRTGLTALTPYSYGMPYDAMYGYPDADRFGAAVTYHFSPSFSIGVSVEGVRYNNSFIPPYLDRYGYPPPR
ncbi:MAG: hypothetical protein IJ196_07260 [Prevotella sp.]|nr:hypothetical protein [Prevotella sp.]